jgi:hypothetical protein
MRRIFYLITELDVGGAEKALFELAARLDRRRFEPVVACLSGRGPFGDRLQENRTKACVRVWPSKRAVTASMAWT